MTYELIDDIHIIEHGAESDKDAICSLTNHLYFNLSRKDTIHEQVVSVDASRYPPTDGMGIPAGEKESVVGTLDLRKPPIFSEAYDTCYLLNEKTLAHRASLK